MTVEDLERHRALRALVTAALTTSSVGFLLIGTTAASVANICPAPGQNDAFTDDNGTTHEANIDCARAYGMVNGTSTTTYAPGGALTRAQAASILVNFGETSSGSVLVDDNVDDFPDDNGSVHEPNIEKAVDNGLLQGFSNGTFGPGVLINRGQFATIAVRTVEFILGSPLSGNGVDDFDDDNGSVHEVNIEKAFDNGIIVGTGTRMFSPAASVTRGQTASIIIRAAGNVLFPAGAFAPAATTTNQTFDVTPAAAATNVVSTSSVDDTGRRTYSANVTGATVDVALFPAGNVTDTNGVVSFADTTGLANRADWTAPPNAVIELVNGAIAPAGTVYLDNVTVPSSGTVTFAIDSQLADEVVPVLFTSAGTSGTPDLPLDAADEPSGDFGVGGGTAWIPAGAASGSFVAHAVEQVDTSTDTFVADPSSTSNGPSTPDVSFVYDSNDAFQFNGVTISMGQFEGMLTGHPSGDVVSITYDASPGNASTFDVLTDDVAPATTVVATAADFDADGQPDDVRLTWTASTQPDAVYDVYRQTSTTCANTSPLAEGNSTDTTTTDLNVPASTYTYCVEAQGGTSASLSSSFAQVDNVVTPPPTDTTGAHVVDEGAAVDTDSATSGTADTGDVLVLLFSEPVSPASGATLAVTDGPNSTNVQNGVNATFVNLDANTIRVTLNQPLTGPAALTYPLTITAAAGLPDAAGNATVFGSWANLDFETGGPEFATDTVTPSGAHSRVVSSTQLDLVFNEAVAAASIACGDFTITSGTCTSTAVSSDGRTVTLTGTAFAGGTTTVAISGGIVTDGAGESTTTQSATLIPAA